MAYAYVLETCIGAFMLLLLFYLYITSDFLYWKNRNVSYIEPKFPFGNIKDLVNNKSDIGRFFKELYDQMPGEKYFGIFEFGTPALVLKDLQIIKTILVKDFNSFIDRGHIHQDVKTDLLATENLFNLKTEKWKTMRNRLAPTFSTGRIKMMFHLMHKCSQQLDKFLASKSENNESIEIKDLFARFTCDVISSCLFGLETNAVEEEDSKVRKITKTVFSTAKWTMFKLVLSIHQPYIYDLFHLTIFPDTAKDFCSKVAKDTYKFRTENNIYRNDFVDLLIKIKQNKNLYEDEKSITPETRNPEGKNDGLTFDEMTAQIFIMLAAGFETSSTTASLALYEMTNHPDILMKAVEDIHQVLQRHNGQITYQSLKEMVYLDQVMTETLRLYPTLPLLTRKCTTTYTVPDSDFIIEKGIRILVPIYAINRDPNIFPDPLRFDPERFNLANKSGIVNLAFGDGPMKCLGMRFGKLQFKCLLVTVLSKYKLTAVPDFPAQVSLNPCQFLTTPIEPLFYNVSQIEVK